MSLLKTKTKTKTKTPNTPRSRPRSIYTYPRNKTHHSVEPYLPPLSPLSTKHSNLPSSHHASNPISEPSHAKASSTVKHRKPVLGARIPTIKFELPRVHPGDLPFSAGPSDNDLDDFDSDSKSDGDGDGDGDGDSDYNYDWALDTSPYPSDEEEEDDEDEDEGYSRHTPIKTIPTKIAKLRTNLLKITHIPFSFSSKPALPKLKARYRNLQAKARNREAKEQRKRDGRWEREVRRKIEGERKVYGEERRGRKGGYGERKGGYGGEGKKEREMGRFSVVVDNSERVRRGRRSRRW
ncbi:hypothetical protein K402DRAFT_105339 [Aulographum hederae CBS 113979]|uniref:Uncharacterized protein n=1 Tax=Aulographum hederae CBS 113979 TaxID=1176131 RepID=A0A6G1GXW5_9PEZI|nr:hypothetical protein K402DRAFT_105339 [Aulographum hederae CBS 113979]